MLAVLHDPFQHRPKLRSAHGFLVPFRQNYRGNLDVLAQFLSRMAAEKEAVEKGRLALRIFEFLQRVFDRVCQRRHNGKPQFTDFNAAVKSPRREIANKLLNALGCFKQLAKLCPADEPWDAARQPTTPPSCMRNRINAWSPETGSGSE